MAIQNAKAYDNIRDSAMNDPLTGLRNSRYLHAFLERELSRAARHGQPLSVLGIDIDNFKAVNDSLGHAVGDTLLKKRQAF